MPESLKSFFDARIVQEIANDICRVWPAFEARSFVSDCLMGLDRMELTERGRHIMLTLRQYLPQDFVRATQILVDSLPDPVAGEELTGMGPFKWLPYIYFVAEYGVDHFTESMAAQHALTQRFSAEFSIRTFIDRHQERTFAQLREWTGDPSPHVRRLVSEGTRPRLPWAPRLKELQKNPYLALPLLEVLKDDPALYVRRSVANHLGDIGKDHAEVAVEVARRWIKDASPERVWVVEHGLRWLVKQGHPGALEVLGYGGRPQIRVERASLVPSSPKIGGSVVLNFDLVSEATGDQDLNVDFVVNYVKADGSSSPKTFKLSQVKLHPGERAQFHKKLSLRQMSTRTHYPGLHVVEVQANGVRLPAGEFLLLG